MKLGIVGLPNVGKSTLFNALTNAGAEAANYPFCTIEPNVGIVTVPDKRLDVLAGMYNPEKYTPAVIEFVDIAGLVKGASNGEGLGNKFLSHIREVDAIVHVIRCFEDENIIHVDGSIDPMRDLETINLELIFSDIEMVERRIDRTVKAARADKKLMGELEVYQRILAALQDGKCARTVELTPDEEACLYDTPLLTRKPVIYVANVCEDEAGSEPLNNPAYCKLKEYAESEGSGILPICAGIEAEIAELDEADQGDFLNDVGLTQPGVNKLLRAAYQSLNLISFFTVGGKENRAWTVTAGTLAPQAAGTIHSDLERGFIRAEVIQYDDLIALGSENACKTAGKLSVEGKNYEVKDGDILHIRFNV